MISPGFCLVKSSRPRMALRFSYITPSQLINLRRSAKVAIVDVRDEERSYDNHIAGSHHYASGSFLERIQNLVGAVQGNDIVVFHCALSQALGKYGIICIEDIVHEIATVGPHFKIVASFLWPFRLKRPERFPKMKKKPYKNGGDSGNREEHINEFINMLN